MTEAKFRQFDDASFSRFRKRLLRNPGSEAQRRLLRAAHTDREFTELIRSEVYATEVQDEAALCSERLTESEYKQPPLSTERQLYDTWSNLAPRIACRTTFWAHLTCRHIEHGLIQAEYLASNGGSGPAGAVRIDQALHSADVNADTAVDRCVRSLFRRLGGLPEARGNKSVYVDCPLARAWWRERLVREVARGHPGQANKVRKATRVSQAFWEELVVLVVSRNSVLGSREVRDQFVLSLAELMAAEPMTPLRIARNLRTACRVVGALQASRELSVLDAKDLRTLMDRVVRLQHDRSKAKRAQIVSGRIDDESCNGLGSQNAGRMKGLATQYAFG